MNALTVDFSVLPNCHCNAGSKPAGQDYLKWMQSMRLPDTMKFMIVATLHIYGSPTITHTIQSRQLEIVLVFVDTIAKINVPGMVKARLIISGMENGDWKTDVPSIGLLAEATNNVVRLMKNAMFTLRISEQGRREFIDLHLLRNQ